MDRRLDHRVVEVGFRQLQGGRVLLDNCIAHTHVGLGCLIVGQGQIVIGVGDGLGGQQAFGPLPLLLRLVAMGLELEQVGLGPNQ